MIQGLTPQVTEFEWLGQRVRATSDSDAFLTLIRTMWGQLEGGGAEQGVRAYDIRVGTGEPEFHGPDGTCRLDPADPVVHAYNLLMTDLHGTVGDHFLLHASCVVRDDRALLISGPSTFGKTTLALRLVDRGFRLVADDVTVVERATGRPVPIGRPLNLRPGTRQLLIPEQLQAAASSTRDAGGDEWIVDPGAWSGPVPAGCHIGMAVLLRSPSESQGTRTFPFLEVRLVQGCREARDELVALPGCSAASDDENPWLVRITIDESRPISEWLRRRRDALVWAIKLPAAGADFTGSPRMTRIGPFQAGLELCQELMNRHEGSALEREFRGRDTELVGEVGAALKRADCFALTTGRLDETLDRLMERFEARK